MPSETSTLRAAVTTAVDALTGWSVSRFAPELFGRDTDQLSHHSFAVAVSVSEPRDGRQSLSDGLLSVSTVDVHWAHRLRADAQSADYSAALDAEQDLVKAVVGVNTQHLLVQRLSRTSRPEGWVSGTATFQAVHRYALS